MVALLDANILLRMRGAVDVAPDFRTIFDEQLLALIREGYSLRCLAAQIREVYAVLTREADRGGGGRSPAEASREIREIIGLIPILPDDESWIETWLVLVERHQITKVQSHDAYLAAAALSTGSTLVTADAGFRRFTGLQLHLVRI